MTPNNKQIKKAPVKKQGILTEKKSNIQVDIANPNKIIDDIEQIHNQTVNTGLRKEDKEYLGAVIDMDLYKTGVFTFENLPGLRLAKEKAILEAGPQKLKGCRKAAARARWYSHQRGRVNRAKKALDDHNKLLAQFDDFKSKKQQEIESDANDLTNLFVKKELQKQGLDELGENKPTEEQMQQTEELVKTTVPDYLKTLNKTITTNSIDSLNSRYNDFAEEMDKIISYEIKDGEAEKEKQAKKKANDKKKKKVEKKGNQAEIKDLENALEVEENLFDDKVKVEHVIKTEVSDYEGQKKVQLSEIATLFRDVLRDNPLSLANKDMSSKANQEARFRQITEYAKKINEYAENLGMKTPEELYYIIELKNNALFLEQSKKFDSKNNLNESYLLLMSSVSKVYYDSLNRYAGYDVSDGLNKYSHEKDTDGDILKNFDILNRRHFAHVRNIRDMASAFANEVRKNRIAIYDMATSQEQKDDLNLKVNVEIISNAQPVNIDPKEKEKELKAKEQQKIYDEWENYIRNDIRGIEAVEDKDTKQKPWVLKDYAEDVLKLMKADPAIQNLKGEEAKRYLISMNDNLYHNLLQLKDELPKTSVGAKFCYVPKMRDDFIEKVKKERFATLLRPDFHYRELLRDNHILDDLFDAPVYVAIKNRQNAIMNAINEELGIDFFTDSRSLASLWADKTIEGILTSTPRDKDEQIDKARGEILKAVKDESEAEEAQANKKDTKEKDKGGNILNYVVQKLLSKNKGYGISDEDFKNTIAKIKATVHDNIVVIDKKMSLLGLCDTSKEILKRSVFKAMGGEYLLGYNSVSEDIIEYTVKNMMAFDGTAAEVQKTWDRKFARTGLPGRLSAKIERIVAQKVNANNKNEEFYLKPKGYKTGADYNNKWNSVNKSTNKIIDSLKKLYNNDIKNLLKNISESEETRSKVQNFTKQYVGDKLKLTKKQWDLIDDYFENVWLESFKGAYENGEYSNKIVKSKLPDVKEKVIAALNKQLTDNFNIREKLGKEDKEELKNFEETLLSRDEYQEEKSNVVVESARKQSVITSDITEQVYRDDLLKKAFKNQEERDLFEKVLENELRDKNSELHANYPYLNEIRSIAQLSDLSLIDYAQFFMDIKKNLSIVGSIDNTKATDLLIIDDWKMSGAGGDAFGVKEKLLKDIISGGMTAQTYKTKFEEYDKEAKEKLSIDRLRLDAILASDYDPNDTYIKFNYLNCVGKKNNQVQRLKRINYAEQFWKTVQDWDEALGMDGKCLEREDRFMKIIQKFLENIPKDASASDKKSKIREFGAYIDKMKITEDTTGGKITYKLDSKQKKDQSKYFGNSFSLVSADLEAIRVIKIIFEDIIRNDKSKKQLTIADCMGEIMLFGCGKQYYGDGHPGAEKFLDSDDNKYYADIAEKSSEFCTKMQNLQAVVSTLNLSSQEQHRMMTKLKPIVAGIKNTQDQKDMADNVNEFGIENILELQMTLQSMYGTDAKAKESLAKSKAMGALYLKRREFIDNYGDLKRGRNGKFRIVRDLMLKDPEVWKKVMTSTDAEFEKFMQEQDELYGLGLDQMLNDAFRGSMPINEQYVISNWNDFKNRKSWTWEDWYNSIMRFHKGFEDAKVGGKSVLDRLKAVQKKMVEAKIDKSEKQGTLLMRMSYILGADPASFALLYDEDEMFAAIEQVEVQYKKNMQYVNEIIDKIANAAGHNEVFDNDPEMDALLKEVANVYINGDMIRQARELIDSRVLARREYEAKDTSEQDMTYANYSLLMQILKPNAYTLNEGNFMTAFKDLIRQYADAQKLARNANIHSDKTVLETKDKVRLAIQVRKGEGKVLQDKENEKFDSYREKKQTLGSIGLIAYNANPQFDSKTIKKALEFVKDHLDNNFGQANEEFINGLLTERAIAFGKMKDEDLADNLRAEKQRLLSLDAELRKRDDLAEDDIQKAIVFAFAQNANRIGLPLDGTHKDDIQEILDELQDRAAAIDIKKPVTRIGQREYEEFMEEMDMARYTMSKADFKEICDHKRKYFELVDACVAKVEAASEDLKVQLGLYDYLKKDIYEAINSNLDTEQFTKTVTEQISKVIGDKVEGIGNLKSEDIREISLNYITDSSKLMQQISSNDVTALEKLSTTSNYTRADMEKEISLSGSKKMIEQYNQLTLEEQKVFAMALTFPDVAMTDAEQLTSNIALRDREKEYQKEVEMQEQLSAFIFNQDFSPKIDYNLVMRRLMKTDKSTGLLRISKTMFDKAMKYTNICISKKIDMQPKDFEKLSDGRMSAEMGRELSGKMGEYSIIQDAMDHGAYYGAKSFKDFFKRFADDEVKKDKSVAKIIEKFSKYSDVQMYMLLHVLQDRTAVDYTTNDGLKKALGLSTVGYANEERRDELRAEFLRPDGMDNEFIRKLNRSVGNEFYENAVATLFSYQLRDDIDLTNKAITSSSFAKDALSRTTKIDWALLERSMEFVDELEDQNLKISICRQTVKHTTDKDAPNVKARALGEEIDKKFRVENLNHFQYFNDFLIREAKKDPEVAMPMISAFNGLSKNEQMLLVHALKHRDILDVSKEGKVTNVLGLSEDRYVNEIGRDQLADYYIDHLSVAGAENVLATNQFDTRDAMESLISTQIADNVDAEKKKTFADNMEGVKIFNWAYIGGRKTGVDWELFGNALKFVKRTESERKFALASAEAYRSAGEIDKYGRFMYNYQYMRKNLSRSGFRVTRFIGRRLKAEIENQIPGWGAGKRVLMACLSPHARNKLLNAGVIKPGTSKNLVTDMLGYSEIAGTGVKSSAMILSLFSQAAQAGSAVVGEGVQQASSALSGLFNVSKDIKNIVALDKPMENEAALKEQADAKREEGAKRQTKEQKLLTDEKNINTDWLLKEVATAAASSANLNDILDTITNFTNVFSTSSIGVTAITNVFVGGIQAAISETLNTARFITRVCTDKKMMSRYFADGGPVGAEIKKLRGENIDKIIADQAHRIDSGSRDILDQSALRKTETEFMDKMSNEELFRKAYGFKDFSEQASYVGWNIVQTLIQSTSPFNTNIEQFMRASMLLAAIGCKDAIGKQDNDTAQRVYDRLMGQDIR